MDYAHGWLWQWTPTGIQRMSFDALPVTQPDQTRETSDCQTQDTDTLDPLHTIVCEAIREGVTQASPHMWFLLPTDQFHRLQPVITPVVFASTPVSAINSTANRPMGSRGRRLEARHFQPTVAGTPGPFMLGDFGKELPENTHLVDLLDPEIPGLSAPPDRASFDFVTSKVRAQLGHFSFQKQEVILTLLRGYEDTVFETRTMPRMPPRRKLDMDITETPGARPVSGRPYPVSPQHLPELERQITALLKAGNIQRSVSLYASPVLFAPKKDGKLRLCIDYQRLNRQTLRDCFPTPVASDLIARTRGARMFSKLDLQSGFHQLRIREGDQHKTAFTTPGAAGAQYEWVTCPFCLNNTPSCFQHLMNHVLFDHITANYCVVYCDNMLIYTETDDSAEHMAKLTAVLDILREHELLIKGSKTKLFQTKVEFLGFQLSAAGWAPTDSKVEAIVEWPAPQTVKHLRSFLGMAKFLRTFLPLYSETSAPLTDLLKNTKHGQNQLNWTLECELAFAKIKEDLTSAPVLHHFDPSCSH